MIFTSEQNRKWYEVTVLKTLKLSSITLSKEFWDLAPDRGKLPRPDLFPGLTSPGFVDIF